MIARLKPGITSAQAQAAMQGAQFSMERIWRIPYAACRAFRATRAAIAVAVYALQPRVLAAQAGVACEPPAAATADEHGPETSANASQNLYDTLIG